RGGGLARAGGAAGGGGGGRGGGGGGRRPARAPPAPPQRRWFGVNPAGPKPTQIARSDIRGFALERVDGQQRLYLDRGADRVEIGAGLRESDREWLVAVLQRGHAPNEAPHLTPAAG